MNPTEEQTAAVDAFQTGGSVVVSALAGCGKTATLALIAESTRRRGQYLAFNRALINDAAGRFPDTIAANTVHSLAFRAIGKHYKARLDNSRRMSSMDIARVLHLEAIDLPTGVGNEKRRLSPGFMAGHVMRAVDRFCQSADPAPTGEHVPYVEGLDLPDGDGRPGWANNRELRRYLAPFVTKAWLDLCQKRGQLRFQHGHYLKMWELSAPVIDTDFLLWDECFPGGTMVETHLGAVPIEKIAECPSEPWSVLSSNDGGRTLCWSNVTSAYRTPRVGSLVRIHHDGGTLTCTANHPLWIEGQGWTPAAMVAEGDTLRYLRCPDGVQGAGLRAALRDDSCQPQQVSGGGSGAAPENLSSHEGSQDGDSQPDAEPGDSGAGKCHTPPDRAQAVDSGRERKGCDEAGSGALRGSDEALRAEALAPRVCRLEWSRIENSGTPALLQNRPRLAGVASGRRGGRGIAQLARATGDGPQEGAGACLSRVARVEVLEPGSDGRSLGGGGEGGRGEVFTLSVGAGCYFADGVLAKNCQDTSKVMESIVLQQKDVQVVAVGDAQQAIYGWMGAHDALTAFEERADHTTSLTQSFRSGPAIAEAANALLAMLGTELRLRGHRDIHSAVTTERLVKPSAVLCRTNAVSVRQVIAHRGAGRRVALVGDGSEVLRFARAAQELQQHGSTSHPDLACFADWPSVQQYVVLDALGGELKLLVQLVDEFGVPVIESALSGLNKEDTAEVVVSTAHKGKGRQWSTVALADDFPVPTADKPLPPEELRLQYVAVTRAQHVLDLSACPTLAAMAAGEEARA